MKRIAFLTAILFFLSISLLVPVSFASTGVAKDSYMTFNSNDLIGMPIKSPQGRQLGFINEIKKRFLRMPQKTHRNMKATTFQKNCQN